VIIPWFHRIGVISSFETIFYFMRKYIRRETKMSITRRTLSIVFDIYFDKSISIVRFCLSSHVLCVHTLFTMKTVRLLSKKSLENGHAAQCRMTKFTLTSLNCYLLQSKSLKLKLNYLPCNRTVIFLYTFLLLMKVHFSARILMNKYTRHQVKQCHLFTE
jgi:hypothetical protein